MIKKSLLVSVNTLNSIMCGIMDCPSERLLMIFKKETLMKYSNKKEQKVPHFTPQAKLNNLKNKTN
jgi:hypothetical protein